MIHFITPFGCKSFYPKRYINILQLCYYSCKPFQTNFGIYFFKREYYRHIVQFHSLIKTSSRASYRLHISILFCLLISWTPRADFPLFESFTNRRKTRGKEKRRGNENRWYLDLNNPQLILRKYHTSGTRNQPVVAVAAVAEFYGTRFPFLSPFVAFLLRFSVVL